jgi:hypothetical protein
VATALFTRSKQQDFWPEKLRNYLLGAVGKNATNRLRTASLQNTTRAIRSPASSPGWPLLRLTIR